MSQEQPYCKPEPDGKFVGRLFYPEQEGGTVRAYVQVADLNATEAFETCEGLMEASEQCRIPAVSTSYPDTPLPPEGHKSLIDFKLYAPSLSPPYHAGSIDISSSTSTRRPPFIMFNSNGLITRPPFTLSPQEEHCLVDRTNDLLEGKRYPNYVPSSDITTSEATGISPFEIAALITAGVTADYLLTKGYISKVLYQTACDMGNIVIHPVIAVQRAYERVTHPTRTAQHALTEFLDGVRNFGTHVSNSPVGRLASTLYNRAAGYTPIRNESLEEALLPTGGEDDHVELTKRTDARERDEEKGDDGSEHREEASHAARAVRNRHHTDMTRV